MKTRTTPTEKQVNLIIDFSKKGTEFQGLIYLYDEDGESIYAKCTDGYVKITENSSQGIDA